MARDPFHSVVEGVMQGGSVAAEVNLPVYSAGFQPIKDWLGRSQMRSYIYFTDILTQIPYCRKFLIPILYKMKGEEFFPLN